MPAKTKTSKSRGGARDKILNAAIIRFSRQSFDEVALRDIAADAKVDVAYVHRAFGSKEKLFQEALRATFILDRLEAIPVSDLEGELTQFVFEREIPEASSEVGELDIAVRSLGSQSATRVLHDFAMKDFIEPLASRLPDYGLQRATLAMACLAGISLFRNVLRVEALSGACEGELDEAIRSVLRAALKAGSDGQDAGDLPGPRVT